MGKSKMCGSCGDLSNQALAQQGVQYVWHDDKPKTEVVYIRATLIHTGECGQVGVRIEQPGGHAVVVPSKSEIFKMKRYEKLEKYAQ